MKLLFSDVSILCSNWSVIKNGYLGIDGETISYIGSDRPSDSYDSEKQMKGHLLLPGLYNLHSHTPMGILRGLGSGLPLDRWLNEAMFPIEGEMTETDVSVGSRLSIMEMLASGVVSFSDMYDRTWTTLDDVLSAGMKANLSRPIMGLDSKEEYDDNFRQKESFRFVEDVLRLNNSRILGDFAIHAEYTSFDDIIAPYARDCKARGGRIHLHLSETQKEHEECKQRHDGKTPTRWFYDLGILDTPTNAAHCVWVEEEDLELLKEKDVSCIHNPSSNMKLGSGFMPIRKMLDKGIRVCLGTDGSASNNNQNMLEEIHLASLIHSGYTNDPTLLKPEELLTMATKNGAIAQGRPDCGELSVGKKADIVALNLDRPHLLPAHDILSLLTYSAQASDVVMTMVDGKILYENGVYLTMDYEKLKFDLDGVMQRLF